MLPSRTAHFPKLAETFGSGRQFITLDGYNPLPEAKTSGELLVRRRTPLAMTQKEAAQRLGVDPSTGAMGAA